MVIMMDDPQADGQWGFHHDALLLVSYSPKTPQISTKKLGVRTF